MLGVPIVGLKMPKRGCFFTDSPGHITISNLKFIPRWDEMPVNSGWIGGWITNGSLRIFPRSCWINMLFVRPYWWADTTYYLSSQCPHCMGPKTSMRRSFLLFNSCWWFISQVLFAAEAQVFVGSKTTLHVRYIPWLNPWHFLVESARVSIQGQAPQYCKCRVLRNQVRGNPHITSILMFPWRIFLRFFPAL